MIWKVLLVFATCLIALFLLLPVSLWAREVFPGLHKTVFANGLTAIVKEGRRAPVVAVQVWVKAGSAYEIDCEAGLTHLIEHMIFKGTEKRGPGMLAREIESVGGSVNAYTSLDYTVYHCEVPSDSFGLALDVLSDAVFHSTFDPEELEREKKVVLEEISMREDRPQSRLSRLLMETSYSVYPYRRPVIGYPENVRAFTRDDILSYMKRRYVPGNITVVVTGDVKAADAFEKIGAFLGGMPGGDPPAHPFPAEPSQEGPRVRSEVMGINQGHLAVTFSGVPSFSDPMVPALDVLAALLGSGESSRLSLALKDRLRLVHTIQAQAFTPMGPGLFEVMATLEPENTRGAVSSILRELFLLKSRRVSPEELDRAKVHIETAFIYSQETMEGEAQKIGMFETLEGDPQAEAFYLAKVRAVTPEDIMHAAKAVFSGNRVNVSMVMPEGKAPLIDEAGVVEMVRRVESEAVASPEDLDQAGPSIHREMLANGLTLLLQESPEVPTVSVQLVMPGGLRYETPETNGVFSFLARAWTRGTTSRSSQAFAEAVEGIGGSIAGFSGQNTFGLKGRFLSRHLDEGLKLFADALFNPTFPAEELDKLRPILISQLKSQEDNLAGLAMREFRRLLFSPHPYGLNPLGKEEVFSDLTSEGLLDLWRQYARPDTGLLVVVGDVRRSAIMPKLQMLFGPWTHRGDFRVPEIPAPDALASSRTLSIPLDKQQDHLVLGFPGASFTNPDRFPLEVLNAVLAGQGGRLFTTLRDKESLAYSVTSLMNPGLDHGFFAFYIACSPDKKEAALNGLWREIRGIRDVAVPAEELERAKNWLIGNYEIDLQTNDARALDMALNDLYGLGYDFVFRYPGRIRSVTPEDVQRVAREILSTEDYVMVQVGP